MSEETIYWRGWTENKLASFQQDQGSSNHCAKFAAATALNLLYGSSLSGIDLVNWLGKRLFRGTGRFTILGNNNGSLVFQTANLLRKLGQQAGLHPEVKLKIGSGGTLREILRDNNSLAIVSLTYFEGREPLIARGTNTASSLGKIHWIGGHLMIPAAYDSNHYNQAGSLTPWGFVSSWKGRDELYWMAEGDFQRTWGMLSIFNMVVIRRRIS